MGRGCVVAGWGCTWVEEAGSGLEGGGVGSIAGFATADPDKGQGTCPVKNWIINPSGFASHVVSGTVTTDTPWVQSRKGHRQRADERLGCGPMKHYLWIQRI